MDNGSTDKTGEIIRKYAEKDSRIVPFFNKINRDYSENPDFWNISHNIPMGDYFCIVDADDYYDPTFFEELLAFMQKNNLDIAACGTEFFDGSTGETLSDWVLNCDVILRTAEDWSRFFQVVHWNLRQVWGKLYTSKAASARYETDLPDWWPSVYGGDTVNVMECVCRNSKFGVYGKKLHHYRVSRKSVSYKWFPGRIEADVTLYNKTMEFLEQVSGSVSKENLEFIGVIYANAVVDTVQVIRNSDLSTTEKMKSYAQIAANEITQRVYRFEEEECRRSRISLINSVLELYTHPYEEKDLQKIMQSLFPHCGLAVTNETLPLMFDKSLSDYMLRDNARELAEQLLNIIDAANERIGNLIALALSRLTVKQKLLFQIKNVTFLRYYKELYLMVWSGKTYEALDWMTGLLIDGGNIVAEETFLTLYINLAATENQEQAYVLGKIRLCKYHCEKKHRQETIELIKELESFGLGQFPEILECKKLLQ